MQRELGLTVAFLAASLIAGCVSSETVYLKHQIKGDTVKCGPYTAGGNIPSANQHTLQELRHCINDFQRQGYERIPAPGS